MMNIINILISCFVLNGIIGEQMLGTGKWSIINTQPCANDAEMPWTLRLRRHKFNRTHDAFDVDFDVGDAIDDSYGIRSDICKMVDGGCKPYMSLSDDSMPNFVRTYVNEENVRSGLTYAGIYPPDFPIPKGELHIKDFVVDMNLTKEGLYGEFAADTFIIKDGQDLACTHIMVTYEPENH